jgi:hypothetical protein
MQNAILKSKSISFSLFILGVGVTSSRAAVYQESGGQAVIEAEHFDSRTTNVDNHHWHAAPAEDVPEEVAVVFGNARGNAYIQALPNSGAAHNTTDTAMTDPVSNYRVFIQTPGTYQLYLRWASLNGNDDSMYGSIAEFMDGPGGAFADWYRYSEGTASPGDFSSQPWRGTGGYERVDAAGNNVAATWPIAKPGLYTIQLRHREDGCAVDTLILQLASLPAPSGAAPGFGPLESAVSTSYPPSFSGRTPGVNAVDVNPTKPIRVQITDGAGAQVDPTSISLTLNQAPLTLSISKSGEVTTITAATPTPPSQLAAGSVNTIDVTFKDATGTSYTDSWSYTIENYATLPAEYAVSASAIDTSAIGLGVVTYQIPGNRGPGNGNTIANAERQIAHGFMDPSTGQPYTNRIVPFITGQGPDELDGPGSYRLPVINWSENPVVDFDLSANANAADAGNFTATGAFPLDCADDRVPGLYGHVDESDSANIGYNDNVTAEVNAYLDLPAGFHTFGVNSDDGFKLSAARGLGDVLGLTLGSFNGARGAADSLFEVYVPAAGIFPVRLIWWEGGGGAACEFFHLDPLTGQKVLINDGPYVFHNNGQAFTSAIKAYAPGAASTTRPHVSRVSPEPGQLFVFADADVSAWITDGTITVDPASVSLTVNGMSVGGATNNGGVAIITRAGSVTKLLPPGVNTNVLIYSYADQGNTVTVTNTWTFTVVPYTVIPAANAVAPGSVNLADLGFKASVDQMDRSLDTNQANGGRLFAGDQNRMPRPEIQLAGGNFNPANGARYRNLAAGGVSSYDLPGVLNFNLVVNGAIASPADSGIFQTAQGYADQSMPGLPGGGTSNAGVDNYVAEFRTYLDLKAGAYLMAVNSDDGFVAISAPNPRDTLGTLLGFANFGRGNANPLPAPPTTKPAPTPGTGNGNSTFQVVAPQDGIYPFRILYWQGGGGVNLEFLSVDKASGLSTLINATSTAGTATNAMGIKAYRTYTGPARPWIKFSVSPSPWDNRYMQAGPGPIVTYGPTRNSTTSSDIYNWQDDARPWADVRIGGVVADAVGDPSLGLLLDGAPVAATLTTNGTDVIVSHKPSPPLASGSTHVASLVYGGTTNSWSFTVQTYTNLQASDAQPLDASDAGSAGFMVKVVQAATTQASTVAGAEAQLADPSVNVAVSGPGPNGTYIFPGIINWNNNLNSTNPGGLPINPDGTPIGNFQSNTYGSGWPFPNYADDPVPGCPGTNRVNCDFAAAEIFAYLKFDTAGYYRFGVNGDDGWAVKVGGPGEPDGTVLFSVDRAAGAADIPFSFTVPQPGLYPIRLVWYNGTGGANLEFFSYDADGIKIPINDPLNPASIKAYYKVTAGTTSLRFTSATVSGGQLMLAWTASAGGPVTLQEATALTGSLKDWSDVPGVVGTAYSVSTTTAAQKFYRLRQ